MRPAQDVWFPIHDLIERRHSARVFAARPLDDAALASLFEAARWAPSSGNEQPWRFVIARRHGGEGEGFARLLETLSGRNPSWAGGAAALLVTATRRGRGPEGKPNPWAWHDAGIAWAMLALQATALGLVTHPMGGFDAGRVRAAIGLPDDLDPVTVTALGWPGDPDTLDEPLRAAERAPRTRRPLAQTVFEERFGVPAVFVAPVGTPGS